MVLPEQTTMWWSTNKNNLPDLFADLFREITAYPDSMLSALARGLPHPQEGDYVHSEPLPLFKVVYMRKLLAVRRQVFGRVQGAIEISDFAGAGAIVQKRDFLQHMLQFFICSIPRPDWVSLDFEWQVSNDFTVAFRKIEPTMVIIPVHLANAPSESPGDVDVPGGDDDPGPTAPPPRDKKRILH